MIYNTGGYFYFFRYNVYDNRKEIKHLIRQGLRDEDLAVIIPSEEQQLTWLKPGKEFRLKDEMYDVVRVKVEQGVKKYFCIKDSVEKKLVSQFIKNHNRRTDKRIRAAVSPFIIENTGTTGLITASDIRYRDLTGHYYSAYKEKSAPPPRRA